MIALLLETAVVLSFVFVAPLVIWLGGSEPSAWITYWAGLAVLSERSIRARTRRLEARS